MKLFQLFSGDLAPLSRLQIPQQNVHDPDSFQRFYPVSTGFTHPPDLSVDSLSQNDTEGKFSDLFNLTFSGSDVQIFQINTFRHFLQKIGCYFPICLYDIFFFMTVGAPHHGIDQISIIGENMNIRRFAKISTDGHIVSYIHAGGKIGVLVEADTDASGEAIDECMKNIAMQVAAMNPKYVSTDEVSEEYKAHELEILVAQAKNDPKNANKPDNIIEKMVQGRLNKELKEVCLLEQEYVKAENKESVAQYVANVAKANGCKLAIKKFVRFETGEGLEKKNEDFAAEVAAQMAGN